MRKKVKPISIASLKEAYRKGRFDAKTRKQPDNPFKAFGEHGWPSPQNKAWKMYNRGYYKNGGRIPCSWDKKENEQIKLFPGLI